MAGNYDGSIIINTEINTDEIKKSMDGLEKAITGGAAKSTQGFKKVDESVESLTKQLDRTNAQIEVESRLLNDLKDKYQRALNVKGPNDPAVLKLQKQVLNAEDAIDGLVKKSDGMAESLRAMDSGTNAATGGMKSLEKSAKSASSKIGKVDAESNSASGGVGKLGDKSSDAASKIRGIGGGATSAISGVSSLTIAMGKLIADGIEKTISAIANMIESTAEFRSDMSKLELNAKDAGVGMEQIDEAMKQFNFIAGDSSASAEALSNLLQSGFKDNQLQQAMDALSGAVVRFPNTLNIESLADSLQETIATGEATGQFGEMLGRVGIDVEDFNKGLQKASKSGRENQYVLDTLAKTGLVEVAKEYEEANASQKAYTDAQYDLEKAQAKIAEKAAPVMAEAIEKIAEIMEEHMDTIETLIDVFGTGVDILLTFVDAIFATIDALKALFSGDFEKFFSIMGSTPDMYKGGMPKTKGYAAGTLSASSGYAWVGESGPELMKNSTSPYYQWVGTSGPALMNLTGGERILNSVESQMIASRFPMLGMSTPASTLNVGNITINPNAQQWGELMTMVGQWRGAAQARRAR